MNTSRTTSTIATVSSDPVPTIERGVWSEEEHDKFLAGLKMFPKGPWRKVAEHVGSRSARQVQTHAQKYYEKVARRVRGLRKDRKHVARSEHRLDEDATRRLTCAKRKEIDAKRTLEPHSENDVAFGPSNALRWTESQVQDDDQMAMWSGDTNGSADPLLDVDDCYLAYLIQILDSSDTAFDDDSL